MGLVNLYTVICTRSSHESAIPFCFEVMEVVNNKPLNDYVSVPDNPKQDIEKHMLVVDKRL